MLGERLKKAREHKGLSRTDVSKILNISINTYRTYEDGTRDPKLDTLVKFANLFEVTVDYLLCYEAKDYNKLDDLKREYNLSENDMTILKHYIELSIREREEFYNFLTKLVGVKGANSITHKEITIIAADTGYIEE